MRHMNYYSEIKSKLIENKIYERLEITKKSWN